MAISDTHIEESISLAHVYAIAGKAGMTIETSNFDYGADGRFGTVVRYGTQLAPGGPTLPFQLKACMNIREIAGGKFSYDMKIDAYNKLRLRNINDFEYPQILLVCSLSTDKEMWVKNDYDQMVLQKCCYFHKFLNMPEVSSTSTTVVHLEKKNLLTPDSLKKLLESVKDKSYATE